MKLNCRVEEALLHNRPFVLYRKPNETQINAWFQNTDKLVQFADFIENSFVFAPFALDEKIYFLQKDCEIFQEEINFLVENNQQKVNDFPTIKNEENIKKQHISLVEKAVSSIKNDEFSKVVLARKEEVSVEKNDFFFYYQRLLQNYPTAFVYWWFHPKVGMWMGATPELLLENQNQTIKTVALAGTISAIGNNKEEIVWGEKEKAEQQIVTDFIVNVLNAHCETVTTSQVYTHQAGNLFHLKTDIQGEISDEKQLEFIVKDLHPTPALCGFPKEKAKEFILQNEGFDREFYGGFLGEYQIKEKQTQLFVNLRCMQLVENRAYIYIGGGINVESIPVNEYEETVNKSKTIKKALN